jgi:Rps23 Pro-64 3,4-dihydroxylase Tpa1-like proline 4-hydroxylase
MMRAYDRDALRRQFSIAEPFRFIKIDDFLDPTFARAIAASYPSFEGALAKGKSFEAVNERKKVQITDASVFPGPVARLNKMIGSAEFLADLSYVTGIPRLLADEQLIGGGMHLTGPGGRLDVHVDFNLLRDRKLYRRLNLLLYLNPIWEESWGGHIQLWDKDVEHCRQSFAPALNRCVIFETSDISFHGVVPVTAAAPYPRISFAAYYYTREAPADWDGKFHSTIFKARPHERIRGLVLMPAAKLRGKLRAGIQSVKQSAKRLIAGTRQTSSRT